MSFKIAINAGGILTSTPKNEITISSQDILKIVNVSVRERGVRQPGLSCLSSIGYPI